MTRGILTARIMRIIAEHAPTTWSASEITVSTGAARRTVERVLNDLLDEKMIEKHYSGYRISLDLMQKIYGSQWFVRQEIEKFMTIMEKKDHG